MDPALVLAPQFILPPVPIRCGRAAALTGQPSDDQDSERQHTARRQGLAYQGAFEAVIAVLIASGLGLWADGHFGTSPWCLLVGTIIGFGSFVLRLLRLGRRLNAPDPGDEDQ